MSNVYPSKNAYDYILCDDVRQEMGGKMTILGSYGGGSIQVGDDTPLPVTMSSLTFLFSFYEGKGKFECSFEVTGPTGSNMLASGKEVISEINKNENESMNVIFKLSPFVIKEYGAYEACVYLDKEKYCRKFNVKKGN